MNLIPAMTRLKSLLRLGILPTARCRRYHGFQTLTLNCSPTNGNIPATARSYSFYKYFPRQQTLNCDKCPYGHANCATFQSYFETAVDHFAIKHCGLRSEQANSRILGVTAETQGNVVNVSSSVPVSVFSCLSVCLSVSVYLSVCLDIFHSFYLNIRLRIPRSRHVYLLYIKYTVRL